MKCFWHFRHLFNPPRFPESIRDRGIRRDVLWDSKQKCWVHSHIWRTLQYKKWVWISYISCKNHECSKSIPVYLVHCRDVALFLHKKGGGGVKPKKIIKSKKKWVPSFVVTSRPKRYEWHGERFKILVCKFGNRDFCKSIVIWDV